VSSTLVIGFLSGLRRLRPQRALRLQKAKIAIYSSIIPLLAHRRAWSGCGRDPDALHDGASGPAGGEPGTVFAYTVYQENGWTNAEPRMTFVS
jgi:hypothetical protein